MSEPDQRFNPGPAAPDEPLLPYPAFVELEQAHLALRQRFHPVDLTFKAEQPSAAEVQAFINRLAATGIVLFERVERRAAQSVLDYWTTQLSSLDDTDPENLTPQLLAPYDAARASKAVNDRTATEFERTATESGQGEQAREIIRLAATARLYQDLGTPGFLLSGKALEVARKFVVLDEDIAELVAASDRQIRNRRLKFVGIGVVSALAASLFLEFVRETILPSMKDGKILKMAQAHGNQKAMKDSLGWLSKYQPFMSVSASRQFYLNAFEFTNIDLQGLRLLAPHFKYTKFNAVKLRGAKLPDGSFIGSVITGSEFAEANLENGRFDGAIIRSSNFSGAQLNNVVFEQSQLCGVDFTGADLQHANFFGASFDDKTLDGLSATAWWLASGWSWKQWTRLNGQRGRRDLSTAKAFLKELSAFEQGVRGARGGADQAGALSALAQLRIRWGIDVHSSRDRNSSSATEGEAEFCARAEASTDVPRTAEDATRKAICLLKSEPDKSQFGQLEGMLGYIALQGRQSQEIAPDQLVRAVSLLKNGVEGWNEKATSRHWLMFTYAAAQYMLGKGDGTRSKAKAFADLQKVLDAGYIPTHELKHLGQTLEDQDGQSEFLDRVATAIKGRWPDTREKSCS